MSGNYLMLDLRNAIWQTRMLTSLFCVDIPVVLFVGIVFCFAFLTCVCPRCENTVHLERHPDGYCLILPPNLKSAIDAVTYMAEQLKKQDTDDSVRGALTRSVAV